MYTWFKLPSLNVSPNHPHTLTRTHTRTHKILLSSPSIKLTFYEPSIPKKNVNFHNCDALHAFKYALNCECWQICAANLQGWDFHCVIDGQGALEDCSSHDCSLTTDGEAVVHGNQQVTSGVSFREVRLFLQKLRRTIRSGNSVGNVDTKMEYHTYTHSRLALLSGSMPSSNFLTVFTGD